MAQQALSTRSQPSVRDDVLDFLERTVSAPASGNYCGVVDAELPAVPVSAGALIFDRAGRLLILKPTYKTGWTIPGGVMEADGETPWDACRREVREECGIEVRGGRLACVDFRPGRRGRLGGIRFLFDCGAADDAALDAITVQPEEIAEYRLVPLPAALLLLRPPIRRRVRAGTRRRRCVYLENGRPVPGITQKPTA
jgi:8-oxo-dGTP diphosphatase